MRIIGHVSNHGVGHKLLYLEDRELELRAEVQRLERHLVAGDTVGAPWLDLQHELALVEDLRLQLARSPPMVEQSADGRWLRLTTKLPELRYRPATEQELKEHVVPLRIVAGRPGPVGCANCLSGSLDHPARCDCTCHHLEDP